MPGSFLVKNVLTETEFERLWDLKHELRDIERTSTSLIAAEAMGGADEVYADVADHERHRIEAETAKAIILEVFSGEQTTPRSDYRTAHAHATPDSFRVLATAFHDVSKQDSGHQARVSGIIVPIAKLLCGAVAKGGSVIVDRDALSNCIPPHIFMDPCHIAQFNEDADPPTAEDQDKATLALDQLQCTLFGVYARDPEHTGLVHNPAPHQSFLTAKILRTPIGIATGSNNHSVNARQRAFNFLSMAKQVHPSLFQQQTVQHLLQDALGNLARQRNSLNCQITFFEDLRIN